MVDATLLKVLCCPETYQELRVADAALVGSLNQRISAGQLKNLTGKPVTETLNGGLVRSDGKFLYPVRNLPVMLVDEAIPLSA